MGNPFDWSARKRRGSGQTTADPYDHYFDDVDFPHFGSTWDAFGRMGKRSQQPHENQPTNDRSGFFNYVPPEFRQYVPEHFGGYFRQHSGQPYMNQQQPSSQQQKPQQQQQPRPQQEAQSQSAPSHSQTQTQPPSSQPSSSKSNLCDAAIQTDDPSCQNIGDRSANNFENGTLVFLFICLEKITMEK